jgi:hypothetical protein
MADKRASDLDENGFYAPGDWTPEQLRAFGKTIDPQIDLGIVRAVKVLSDAGIATFESCEGAGQGTACRIQRSGSTEVPPTPTGGGPCQSV